VTARKMHIQLGVGALALSALLLLYLIPIWVSSPSNVRNIILSPRFWPYALTLFTALTGLGLLFTARAQDDSATVNDAISDTGMGLARLAAMAVLMLAIMWLLPRLGMVWTCMLAFAATAFLFRTRHPVTAIICAVVVPLALYAFFAHVAGVAIPQGNLVRLP
jgi:hypothetical protein